MKNRAEQEPADTGSSPGPGACIPSRKVRKAAKLQKQCGGFEKLSVFLLLRVLDRSSSSGQRPEELPSTLCTLFSPHE